MNNARRVSVAGERPYDVVVGYDVLSEVEGLLPDDAGRAVVVHAPTTAAVAGRVAGAVTAAGREVVRVVVPDGELAKTADVAAGCWHAMGEAHVGRTDVVIGVGGGATTDLAGFVAATWLRGVPVVQVPTTLLGMVDAAVGGKTGIDTAHGKNLVGAFHPPLGVVCDLAVLATLPAHEYASGLAEVVKVGLVADPEIVHILESDSRAASRWDGPHTEELVVRAVAVKAAVVGADPREVGKREVLNYGHTLGHAIERVEDYRWRHGAAVSVGMVFAAELSGLAGRLDRAVIDRHRVLLGSLDLPTSYRADAWPELLQAMSVDKKVRNGRLRFVVLDDLARPGRLEAPDQALLKAAYDKVAS